MTPFDLILNSPEVTLKLTATDCSGTEDILNVIYRRHTIAEAQKIMDLLITAETDLDGVLATAEADGQTPDAAELVKSNKLLTDIQFGVISDNIVDFLKVSCGGKVLPSLRDNTEPELVASYLQVLWASAPYREALRNGLYSALRNTL